MSECVRVCVSVCAYGRIKKRARERNIEMNHLSGKENHSNNNSSM